MNINLKETTIVFLTSYFYPVGGGIANVVEDLAVELAKRKGISVEIIARGIRGTKKNELYKGINVKRIKVINIPGIRDIIFMLKLLFILSKNNYSKKIIHCNEAHTMGFVGYLLKFIDKKRKIIIQTHGWDLNRFLEKYVWTRWLLKKILSSSDLLLPLSFFQKRQILNFVKPKNLYVFPDCRDINKTKLSKEECKKKWNLPKDMINIIFVGRKISRKGSDIFIDVVKSLKGVKGHIVGFSGDSDYKIKYYSEISQEAVFEIMKGCDIFLFPTKKEAFGLVFLEAAASGLAIITSNGPRAGGGTDIFTHKKNALLVPRNIKNMKQAVIYLLKNKSKMDTLSKNVKKVCNDFTPKKIANKYLSILSKVFIK